MLGGFGSFRGVLRVLGKVLGGVRGFGGFWGVEL